LRCYRPTVAVAPSDAAMRWALWVLLLALCLALALALVLALI